MRVGLLTCCRSNFKSCVFVALLLIPYADVPLSLWDLHRPLPAHSLPELIGSADAKTLCSLTDACTVAGYASIPSIKLLNDEYCLFAGTGREDKVQPPLALERIIDFTDSVLALRSAQQLLDVSSGSPHWLSLADLQGVHRGELSEPERGSACLRAKEGVYIKPFARMRTRWPLSCLSPFPKGSCFCVLANPPGVVPCRACGCPWTPAPTPCWAC